MRISNWQADVVRLDANKPEHPFSDCPVQNSFGDLTSNSSAQAATSDNGGQTWTLTKKPPIPGAIFCLAYARGLEARDRARGPVWVPSVRCHVEF